MPDPDDLASALAGIDQRAQAAAVMIPDVLAAFNGVSVGGVIAASALDVPVLFAALEAVLNLADEAEPVDRDYGGEPIWWSLKPGEVREVITRVLTGEAPADAR